MTNVASVLKAEITAAELYRHFEITPEAVVVEARRLLQFR
jgi:hypothetical protein